MSVETRYKVLLWVTELVYCLKCHAIDNCQKFGSFSPCGPHNTFKKFTAAKSWNVGFFVRCDKRFWSFLQGRMKDQKGVKTAARFATPPPPTSCSSLWFPKIHITCVGVCICQREHPKTALTLTTLYRPSLTPELRHSARWQEERFFSALERPD